MKNITDINLNNKIILIRTDLNIPIVNGKISSDARILSALPTIKYALEHGKKVILCTHLGRPLEGVFDSKYSLNIVAKELLKHFEEFQIENIELIKFNSNSNYIKEIDITKLSKLSLLENIRFNIGEKSNNIKLSKDLASLADVFIMDAFATSHRCHSSTYGVMDFINEYTAGLLLSKEISALEKLLKNNDSNSKTLAIVGGAKVSTKLDLLESLLDNIDQLVVGGGIANTFLKAQGYNIGKSLYEKDLVKNAQNIIVKAKKLNKEILIPIDVRVAQTFDNKAVSTIKNLNEIADNDIILDIGTATEEQLEKVISNASKIIFNGPLGVFEFDNFSHGTKVLTKAIAKSKAFTLAGGGDTISAIEKFNVVKDIDYISSAGGAFLEFLEGKKLPVIEKLKSNN